MKVFHQLSSLAFLPFEPSAQNVAEYQFSSKFPFAAWLDVFKAEDSFSLLDISKNHGKMQDYFWNYPLRNDFEKRKFCSTHVTSLSFDSFLCTKTNPTTMTRKR